MAGSAAIAFLGIDNRDEGVLRFGKYVADGIIGTPTPTSRTFSLPAQEADVHVYMGQSDFYILFGVKWDAIQRPTRTDFGAAGAIFAAIVGLEIQYGGQE